MVTLLKLGGSLITNKTVSQSFHTDTVARIAAEIAEAQSQNPTQIIIGHGSGSFGHFEAKTHNTIQGVHTADQWVGFSKVATIAATLNYLVTKVFHEQGLPVLRIQPSASAICEDGEIVEMALGTIKVALEQGLIPLVYGDVAIDRVRGGTIVSTETIFQYLAKMLPIDRIVLVGEVDGVYDTQGDVIPTITPANFETVRHAIRGSAGVDVTGGMDTKVQDMLATATEPPFPITHIINGTKAGLLRSALIGESVLGTIIRRD